MRIVSANPLGQYNIFKNHQWDGKRRCAKRYIGNKGTIILQTIVGFKVILP
ncbi:MAG: hypothetical protein KBH82_10285 [Syntrophorhabdaceae bacterium]|nr:hypothetical protein [Syntrophorhabdaceae bacterium]